MAAEVVGGAFLSAFLDVVFARLSPPEAANLIRGKKLDQKLLQRLKTTLKAVRAMLNDAQQKQIKDDDVKKWLDDLQDAVYEADDLLDEVSTKAATQKEVSNVFSRYLNLQDRETVNNLENITKRLESIVKDKEVLGLKEIARENFPWRAPSTYLVQESNMYGRVQDKEAIIKLLDDNSDDKISVIPIVGMGGVGKTTLAQWVYNDDSLMQKFDLKAWVCVSEEFDILRVTKTIIEAVASAACSMKDLNLLQHHLKEKLTGKKFFVVLDDVWNEDYDNWNVLLKPFQYGTKGSKILVTTRSKKVASGVRNLRPHVLCPLSNEDCWSVFKDHALLSMESCEDSALEKIGREIVGKCGGLPLAAQTLGRLLQATRDLRDWNTILKTDIWELSEDESKIIPALKISYHYLPSHLKRCFAYCSLYLKDYQLEKDEIILLWMAEDLLQQPKSGQTLEEIGCEYFDNLASRSFFQHHRHQRKCFGMHDLMHDLATSVAGEFYFRVEEHGKGSEEMSDGTRHLSYISFSGGISKIFEAFGRIKFLRTFLPLSIYFSENPASIVLKSKYLRVLSFHSFLAIDELPDSIGELIHLRYLDMSRTSIKTLPESLSNLYNLQTLKLVECFKLTMLPSGMQNLVNLRHLNIAGSGLKEMPRGMGKLRHLQFLSGFAVGKHEENGIKELGKLSNLHGSLEISGLQNATNSSEALEARMVDKKHINRLRLKWSPGCDMDTSSQIERDILDKLQPHEGLESLTIVGYRGTRFPDWVGHFSHNNMTVVELYQCSNCCMLPSLGQLPSLKYLKIEYCIGLGTIGAEFYKNDDDHSSATPFPSLESLTFYHMPCWQVWRSSESDAFPKLKRLEISDCPILKGDLPNHLPALEQLSISACEQLASSLPRAPAIRKLSIHGSNKVGLQELPLSLHFLSIEGCQLAESVFEAFAVTQPTLLRDLRISKCSSAISFPGGCLPASLKSLQIWNCRKLEFSKQQHELLESIIINDSCDSLTSFPFEAFPNLRFLDIIKCENMQSFLVSKDANIQNLISFSIRNCPNFVSFPKEGLAAPRLTSFEVKYCTNLKSLPSHMNTLIPKLERLSITDCSEIDSFPGGGLSPNLRSLDISYSEKLVSSLASMEKHELSLTHLCISGPCESVKSFPKECLLPLPSSLASLRLVGFSSMETLDCKGLLHLTSLQELDIVDCPKLENMAGERLPASLIFLLIQGSPLLEERFPQIWPKITHNPNIQVIR